MIILPDISNWESTSFLWSNKLCCVCVLNKVLKAGRDVGDSAMRMRMRAAKKHVKPPVSSNMAETKADLVLDRDQVIKL